MSYVRKNSASVRGLIFGVIVLTAIAIWQFYLFATFRNEDGIVDVEGGTSHLWLAIGMAILACIASFFIFLVFVRHDTDDELHITS